MLVWWVDGNEIFKSINEKLSLIETGVDSYLLYLVAAKIQITLIQKYVHSIISSITNFFEELLGNLRNNLK